MTETEEHPPVVLRHCGWPDCPNAFDIVAQMGSGPYVHGWLQSRVAGHICPDHATAGHLPRLTYQHTELPTATVICECDWPSEPQPTLGHANRAWQQHVTEETR